VVWIVVLERAEHRRELAERRRERIARMFRGRP
jgi:hypothetical protein